MPKRRRRGLRRLVRSIFRRIAYRIRRSKRSDIRESRPYRVETDILDNTTYYRGATTSYIADELKQQIEDLLATTTDPTILEEIYTTATTMLPTESWLHHRIQERIREVKEREHEQEQRRVEETVETARKEAYQESVETINIFYDDIDDTLLEYLTPEEVDALMAIIFDSIAGGRTFIPLDWLEDPRKIEVARAWLTINWGRYHPINWFAVAITPSVADRFAKLYPRMRFRVYAWICWERPDAPEPYRSRSKGDRTCINAYVGTLYGDELPLLLDPSFARDFLANAPTYDNWADYLESADSIQFWVKKERD